MDRQALLENLNSLEPSKVPVASIHWFDLKTGSSSASLSVKKAATFVLTHLARSPFEDDALNRNILP